MSLRGHVEQHALTFLESYPIPVLVAGPVEPAVDRHRQGERHRLLAVVVGFDLRALGELAADERQLAAVGERIVEGNVLPRRRRRWDSDRAPRAGLDVWSAELDLDLLATTPTGRGDVRRVGDLTERQPVDSAGRPLEEGALHTDDVATVRLDRVVEQRVQTERVLGAGEDTALDIEQFEARVEEADLGLAAQQGVHTVSQHC